MPIPMIEWATLVCCRAKKREKHDHLFTSMNDRAINIEFNFCCADPFLQVLMPFSVKINQSLVVFDDY